MSPLSLLFLYGRMNWWMRVDSNYRRSEGPGDLQSPAVAAGPRIRTLAVRTRIERAGAVADTHCLANSLACPCRPHQKLWRKAEESNPHPFQEPARVSKPVAAHAAGAFRKTLQELEHRRGLEPRKGDFADHRLGPLRHPTPKLYGLDDRSRTDTPCGTATSRLRGCQLRHVEIGVHAQIRTENHRV